MTLAGLLQTPVHEVANHPELSMATAVLRARRKYRAEVVSQAFQELERQKDEMGMGRALFLLGRIWVEG